MGLIDALSPKQEARLATWRDEWVAVVGATGTADRPRAEAAITRIYADAGEPAPAFFWVDSPAAGMFAVASLRLMTSVGAAVGGRAGRPGDTGRPFTTPLTNVLSARRGTAPPPTIGDLYNLRIGRDLDSKLDQVLRTPIVDLQSTSLLWAILSRTAWAGLRPTWADDDGRWEDHFDAHWSPTPELVYALVNLLGPHGMRTLPRSWIQQVAADLGGITLITDPEDYTTPYHWLDDIWFDRPEHTAAKYAFVRDVLGVELPGLAPWETAARACGPWWPLRGICVVSERPIARHRDDRDRLHHRSEAALRFRDGFGVHSWRGTTVPRSWIAHPDRMDPLQALRASNAERRRAAAEIVGWERVLARADARVIDRHDDPMVGELVEILLPHDPESGHDGMLGYYTRIPPPTPARFLRVRCGTGRAFALRVPVAMQTALAANAWTYSLTPDEYKLEARA